MPQNQQPPGSAWTVSLDISESLTLHHCRKRRVKCDEARPVCSRCATTGRQCDGYAQPTPLAYSWDELLAPRMLLAAGASTASDDRRALAYFRDIVTKDLFHSLGGSGWIQHVSQLVQSEPAGTHAALAIVALYKQLSQARFGTQQRPHENVVAIEHYNAAIRCMLTAPTSCSPDFTLVVCALFICIEFLRSDARAAISHCRHGIHLLNLQQGRSVVASIFYHWSVLPFFQGVPVQSLPRLKDPGLSINMSFENHTQAQEAIDWLSARALQLGQNGNDHRLAVGSTLRPSDHLTREQKELTEALRAWSLAFSRLQQATKPSSDTMARMLLLEMRWLVWKVYVSACLEQNEMVFDAYLGDFKRMLEISAYIQASKRRGLGDGSTLSLEMGHYTSVYFIVVNCRHLGMRLAALQMLKLASQPREMIWNVATFYAIGKHLIEIEHEMKLTAKVIKQGGNSPGHLSFPPDRQRIRGTMLAPDPAPHLDDKGTQMPRQRLNFFMPGRDGKGTYTLTRDIPFDGALVS